MRWALLLLLQGEMFQLRIYAYPKLPVLRGTHLEEELLLACPPREVAVGTWLCLHGLILLPRLKYARLPANLASRDGAGTHQTKPTVGIERGGVAKKR